MDNKKSYEVDIDSYCFIPKDLKEIVKEKLETSNRRWDNIVEIIKNRKKTVKP
jgi:nitrate/TMAO reductase-like tetraheme cytochrome c subunit